MKNSTVALASCSCLASFSDSSYGMSRSVFPALTKTCASSVENGSSGSGTCPWRIAAFFTTVECLWRSAAIMFAPLLKPTNIASCN